MRTTGRTELENRNLKGRRGEYLNATTGIEKIAQVDVERQNSRATSKNNASMRLVAKRAKGADDESLPAAAR